MKRRVDKANSNLKRIQNIGGLLGIILFSITLIACSSEISTGKISDNKEAERVIAEDESTNEVTNDEINVENNTEADDNINVENDDKINVENENNEETDDEINTGINKADKSNEKVEISMEEAIEIGAKEAEKYYDNLKLTEVHSYDNDHEPSMEAGIDGKREWWYVNFGNKDQNYVNILIQDGKIVSVSNFEENGNNGLLDLSEIKLTAQEAAKKAKESGLQGGNPDKEEEWVSGYNFKLSFSSLAKSPEDTRVFLEVIGVSQNGNFAHVDFDAVSGELLLAEEKFEYEDGTFEWKPFK